jgi:hypothetical protein
MSHPLADATEMPPTKLHPSARCHLFSSASRAVKTPQSGQPGMGRRQEKLKAGWGGRGTQTQCERRWAHVRVPRRARGRCSLLCIHSALQPRGKFRSKGPSLPGRSGLRGGLRWGGQSAQRSPQVQVEGPATWCPYHRGLGLPQPSRLRRWGMLQVRGPRPLQVPHLSNVRGWPGQPPRSRTATGPVTSAPNSRSAPAAGQPRPSPGGHRGPGRSEDAGEGAPEVRIPPRGGAWGGARGVPSVEGTPGQPRGFVCSPGGGHPAREGTGRGHQGSRRLGLPRPPTLARLWLAHLGSAPTPPALCAPGSARLGSAPQARRGRALLSAAGRAGQAGGAGGRSRPA